MFSKNKKQQDSSMVLPPQDDFSSQIYNQSSQIYNQAQNQPQFQAPIQQAQPVQPKPETKAVITRVELTEGIIHFEGQANYLISIGDCQINQ